MEQMQYLKRLIINRRGTFVVVAAGAGYVLAGLPNSGWVLTLAALVLLYRARESLRFDRLIDRRLAAALDTERFAAWPVHTKVYPRYQFVDIYRAVQAIVGARPGCVEIRSEHDEELATILNRRFHTGESRKVKHSTMVARKVNYDDEMYLPCDSFWVVPSTADEQALIVRVRLQEYTEQVILEVATSLGEAATPLISTIEKRAAADSIYRNHLLEVTFTPLSIAFHRDPDITEADIILEPALQAIIERTIVDFHQRRERLMQAGLPGKRGVLFYGPPGTGKTYTCKFLARRLADATTIAVTGRQMVEISAVCEIARLLQPAVVLLEDVDLIYADREINPHGEVLGELMDQLDGFGENDQVLFVLTTNAIERVEAAIKDRPGRISQCIYFGPPGADLRRRYLSQLLERFDSDAVDLARLVAKTAGTTQAFLKELLYRAVQIATERCLSSAQTITLLNDDFDTALQEMTSAGGRSGKRIIGFHIEDMALNGVG